MEMTVEQVQGQVPITVLALDGALDASNFEDVIAKAQDIYNSGSRYLLLDLTQLTFMSSSGMAAMHSVTLLMNGDEPPDLEQGWAVFHSMVRDRESGLQPHLKILNPQPPVERVLKLSGMDNFIEILTDKEAAIAAFASTG